MHSIYKVYQIGWLKQHNGEKKAGQIGWLKQHNGKKKAGQESKRHGSTFYPAFTQKIDIYLGKALNLL